VSALRHEPAISRLRRPDELFEAAWSYYGEGCTEFGNSCGVNSGCIKFEREGGEFEHFAGPGCICARDILDIESC
jgi:hypothetical protein